MKLTKVRLGWMAVIFPWVSLTVLVFALPLTADGDLYYHLKSGELMLRWGHLLRTDVFTFTARGTPEEMHSWLSQIFFFVIYRSSGATGLRLLELTTFSLAVWLAFRYVLTRTGEPLYAALIASFALYFIQPAITLRPLIWAIGFLALIVLGLLSKEMPLRPTRLVVILLLGAVWVNLHPSALLLLPILMLVCASQLVGLWEDRREGSGNPFWRSERMPWVVAPILMFPMLCLTPMGVKLFVVARKIQATGQFSLINEWRPIALVRALSHFHGWSAFLTALDFESVALVAGLAGLLVYLPLSRKQKLSERVFLAGLSALFFLLPFTARRHIPYAFLGFTLLAPEWWELARPYLVVARISVARAALFAGMAFLLTKGSLYETTVAPVSIEKAATLLSEAGVQGNLFNDPDWGHYLTYRLYPRCLISFDMRASVNAKAFHFLMNQVTAPGGLKPERLVESFPQADIIFTRDGDRFEKVFDPSKWILVFENDTSIVALRRNARNRENLRRIAAYYAAQGVPFNRVRGYDSFRVHLERPDWFWGHQEIGVLGVWPTQRLKDRFRSILTSYLARRDIPI